MRPRSSPRIKVTNIYATIEKKRFLVSSSGEKLVKVYDIGPKGFSFEYEEALDVGSRFNFVISLPKGREIQCRGRIKNVRKMREKRHILGVEISKLSPDDRKFLSATRNLLELAGITFTGTGMALEERLKLLRNALGMTVGELAQSSGVSTSDITRIESGIEKTPAPKVLMMLAKGMGISAADLGVPE